MTADNPRLRLGIVAIVALSLFAALVARLWYLQVLSAPEFQVQARANSIREVEEPAPRGRILDRNGVVLVDNRASNVVAVDRSVLPEEKEQRALLRRLAPVLGEPVDVLVERLESQRVSPYTPAPVKEDVSDAVMTHLMERADDFPGVVAKRVAVRTYPFESLAAHVLGYIGEVAPADLAEFPTYEQGELIGKAGVERVYESALRGTPGLLRIEVDAEGKPIRVVSRKAPVQGYDVKLSLDVEVQRTAEVALAEGLESTRRQRFEDDGRHLIADAGSVVASTLDGTITAMASYPTFDLPDLADGITHAEWAVLNPPDGKAAPFVNRAIQGQYPPGSTWKLVTADAALRRGLITPNFSLNDTGEYITPGDCSKRACRRQNAGGKAYGRVGVRKALAVSSDVFFYTMGGDFWIDRRQFGETPIQDVALRYGFGTQTGIALPNEKSGRVLSRRVKQDLLEQYPGLYTEGWYTGDNVSLAIGQAVMTVTPLQIANAYAMFANPEGTRYQPNIALQIQKQDGTVVETIGRRLAGARLELPPHLRAPIEAGLVEVVSDPDGTAYNAFAGFPLRQYGIAGKTGTAQAPPGQDHALFVGYGPVAAPEYVVSVVMEQSGFGASAAAPVARRVFGALSKLETGANRVQFTPANGLGD